MLVFSIILINLALIIYSIAIFNQFIRRTLLSWHIVMFVIGFICDFSGTFMMYIIAGSKIGTSFHAILGYFSLFLMLCNAIASIFIFNKRDRKLIRNFYKFGIFAWFIWIISYIIGLVVNM